MIQMYTLYLVLLVLVLMGLFGWLGVMLGKKNKWHYWVNMGLGVLGTLIGLVVGVLLTFAIIPCGISGC